MLATIQDTVNSHLPSKRKTSNEWTTFNCPCCVHVGESQDKRMRGHIKMNGDGSINFGCFNCNTKVNYTPGRQLSYKFRRFLSWLGVDEATIQRHILDALRDKQHYDPTTLPKKEELKVSFEKHKLPDEAVSFYGMIEFYELKSTPGEALQYPQGFVDAVTYISNRKIDMRKYEFYWSTLKTFRMNKRVIIPFTWKDDVVGYTARALDNVMKPKYIMEVDEGFVFNIDKQKDDWEFVIVSEGPFDAMAVDGVAVLHDKVNAKQAEILESLEREIIVVPHWDKAGSSLIDDALEHGWSVSFPIWADQCKDIGEAVEKYGKLFVLKSIIDNVERNNLKIQLRRKYG